MFFFFFFSLFQLVSSLLSLARCQFVQIFVIWLIAVRFVVAKQLFGMNAAYVAMHIVMMMMMTPWLTGVWDALAAPLGCVDSA